MATDPRKRQQKLVRRASKRKDKKHAVAREQSQGIAGRLTAAAHYPILHAMVSEYKADLGIGWVLLSRLAPDGSVAVATFLVDRFCLGVKDADARFVTRSRYEDWYLPRMQSDRGKAMTPAAARKFVEGAVEYANRLGIPPHADYHKAKLLFGDVDPAESGEEFTYGKDGKPYFVAGPYDTPPRCRQIIATLLEHCGAGEFHYMIPLSDPEEVLPAELRQEPLYVFGEDEQGRPVDRRLDPQPDRGPRW